MKTLLAVLAIYRLSYMLVYETGPFAIFEKLRGLVFERLADDSWIVQGFNCVLCISFWLSFIVAFFTDGDYLLSALGVAGGVAIIHLFLERD